MTRTKLLIISMSTARSLHLQSKIQPETHSAPNSSSENNPYWYSSELTVRLQTGSAGYRRGLERTERRPQIPAGNDSRKETAEVVSNYGKRINSQCHSTWIPAVRFSPSSPTIRFPGYILSIRITKSSG